MKRILGIDYGDRRVGIAISDPLQILARGLKTIPQSSKIFDELRLLAKEYDVEKIIVGMPTNLKGNRGMKALEVERFIDSLKEATGLEILPWDERFTSHIAHQTLHSMGVKKQQRQTKDRIDEMASALILQGYLDHQRVRITPST